MYYLFLLAVLGFSVLSSVAGEDSELCRSNINGTALNRQKRRASCKKWREWQCLDGTCIPIESKCDGVVDCSDGSDETHAICRNTQCQENWFRCTYGACVDGTAACNGKQECADNSDELLPRCRNETSNEAQQFSRKFKCLNGEVIPSTNLCDGVEDCSDKSDETLATCASTYCASPYFRCAYGACVDRGSDCDGKVNCADGSDEDDVLCNRTLSTKPMKISKNPNQNILGNKDSSERCTLPPYPKNGVYVADGISTKPGENFGDGYINFTCNEGYTLVGRSSVACFRGEWQSEFPECGRFCKIVNKVSMRYECMEGDSNSTRKCREYEPVGTQVKHHCNTNYRPDGAQLDFMVCKEDGWANVPRCIPDCGKVTPSAVALIMGGWVAEKGELPWHTGIYLKEILKETNVLHYKHICGGSLVTTSVVLSAANCFWKSNQLQPPENYAVALGKLYRKWKTDELGEQKSDVKEIHVPPLYMDDVNRFSADIAVVVLQKAIKYQLHIRPVCIDFKQELTNKQLQPGNMAKVAGWGVISKTKHSASKKLKVVDLPYVDTDVCIHNSTEEFRPLVTVNKFCAGYANGTALCEGDSGGGLVFREKDSGRYYLRGIVSSGNNINHEFCDSKSFNTFTNIQKYKDFINNYLHDDDF